MAGWMWALSLNLFQIIVSKKRKKYFLSEAVLLVIKANIACQKKRSVDFKEIRQERILMINSNYMYYDLVKEKCLEAGFMPRFAFESYQWEFIFEMVANDQRDNHCQSH